MRKHFGTKSDMAFSVMKNDIILGMMPVMHSSDIPVATKISTILSIFLLGFYIYKCTLDINLHFYFRWEAIHRKTRNCPRRILTFC